MNSNLGVLGALLTVLLPATVWAQAASPGAETQLQQEMRHRRVIVRPSTPPDEVQKDVDQASTEIQRRNADSLTRDVTRPGSSPTRRPDLDYDVKGGIQTRSLNDALRR
jgi:hypothetical protein